MNFLLTRRRVPAAAIAVLGAGIAGCDEQVRALTTLRRNPSPAPPSRPHALQARHFRTHTASGYAPAKKYKVGILGATGAVGQRFVQFLEGHPWFEVTRLGASERSEGKAYKAAVNWGVSPDVPEFVRDMRVVSVDPKDFGADVDLVFSALVSCRVLWTRARAPPPRPHARVPPLCAHRMLP